MHVAEIVVGTVLKMEHGGEYRVVRINDDVIELEHTELEACVRVYLEDLPEMFMDLTSSPA